MGQRTRHAWLRGPASSEDSAAVRERVIKARDRQRERYKTEKKTYCNAQRAPKLIRKYCAILTDGEKLLENAVTKLGLSARAHDRILKVARNNSGSGWRGIVRSKTSERGDSVPDAGRVVLGVTVWAET